MKANEKTLLKMGKGRIIFTLRILKHIFIIKIMFSEAILKTRVQEINTLKCSLWVGFYFETDPGSLPALDSAILSPALLNGRAGSSGCY